MYTVHILLTQQPYDFIGMIAEDEAKEKRSGVMESKILNKDGCGQFVARAELVPGCARISKVWASVLAASLLADQGLGVAGVPIQQQPEWHPGR